MYICYIPYSVSDMKYASSTISRESFNGKETIEFVIKKIPRFPLKNQCLNSSKFYLKQSYETKKTRRHIFSNNKENTIRP